jgi:drug/metabolite transporter (DMT)-like permease
MSAGVLAVSTASLFVRYAQQAGAPSLTIAALRLTIASAILLPLAGARCRDELRRLSRRDLLIGLVSGAFLGLHFATWIGSLHYTSITSSVVLVTLAPVFVALGSAVFLRERLDRRAAFGMLMAVAGGMLIGVADAQSSVAAPAPDPLLGNLLALSGAISIAPHFLIGRVLRMKLSLLAYIAVVYSAAAAFLLAAALLTGAPLAGFDPQAYLWIAALALAPQLIGHTSFNWALGHLPATYATIPALGEPVGSTLLAVLLLAEPLTPAKVAGGALVLAGILLMSLKRGAAGGGAAGGGA